MRVCIVGGGLTGAATAAAIRLRLPQAHIELRDKAARFGGRMCTKRPPAEPRSCNVDVGAQYISSTPHHYSKHQKHYSELLSQGVLQPLSCPITGDRNPAGTKHFVAPHGMAAVVQYYVDKAACNSVRLGVPVQTLTRQMCDDGSDRPRWSVAAAGDSTEGQDLFDVVLLTLPVPQILALKGDLIPAIGEVSDLRESLEGVQYSSRFCLGLFYSSATASQITLPDGAGALYLNDPESPFCYVAVDNIRRGIKTAGGVSVLAHTSRSWGAVHVEQTKEETLPQLLQQFRKVMPQWPDPDQALCHKWRYSQVVRGVSGGHGGSVALAGGSLVLSGDAFTASTVDGCLVAAAHAADTIVQN